MESSNNIIKTQYLFIGEESTGLNLKNNEVIKECERYKYLGIHFDTDGTR